MCCIVCWVTVTGVYTCHLKDDDEDQQQLLEKPREYQVKFSFPDPPPLNPPILGAYGKCCVYVCMCVRMCVCMCVCVCVHACV